MQLRENFKRSEIECPCCEMMNATDELLDKLQDLRNHFERPIIVNSCCRCETRNQEQGGAPSSRHLNGEAADLSISQLPLEDAKRFVQLCLDIFPFVIAYPRHIHVDLRTESGFLVKEYS